MTIIHFLIPLLAALTGIAQAAAERVVDFFSWNNSIFASKYPTSVTVEDLRNERPKFTHPREVSWLRKYFGPKWLQRLRPTVLVGTTDLWHAGDTFTSLVAFVGIPLAVYFLNWTSPLQFILVLIGSWATYSLTFHLFYHKFFYNSVTSKYAKVAKEAFAQVANQ